MLAVFKTGRGVAALGLLTLLGACQQENTYVPPPPPTVGVANPIQKTVQPYLEATGNMAAVNSVNLVARVQGFLQEIDYKDGAAVKKGTKLFVIEPEPYKLKVDQAQAALEGAKAQLLNSQIEFDRQQTLVSRQISTQASFDQARATRDLNQATVDQDQANLQQAQINKGYTEVDAPFDGTVTQHLVSVGELVGTNSPTQLATIYQLDPIWVNFTISERDVQTIRAAMAKHGITTADIVNKVSCRGRAADRDQAFPIKASSIISRRMSIPRLARCMCAVSSTTKRSGFCPAISCVCICRCGRSMPCWCRTRRSAPIRVAAMSSSSTPAMSSSSAR